jgi:hypothetical protein
MDITVQVIKYLGPFVSLWIIRLYIVAIHTTVITSNSIQSVPKDTNSNGISR